MTRIIAGDARGHSLVVPKSGTRPTSDRVREAMFSSLGALIELRGASVLDLYAGSGALALEAVSRGAARAVLVEQAKSAVAVVKRNVEVVTRVVEQQSGGAPTVRVAQSSVASFLAGPGPGRFDLVFIDPPYDLAEADLTSVLAALLPHLHDEAIVIVERGARTPEPAAPDALRQLKRRAYGETAVYSYELVSAP